MKRVLHNRHLQICAALLAADCLVFTVVNPRTSGAVWLIIGYGLLGLTLFGLGSLLAHSLRSYSPGVQQTCRRLLRYSVAAVVLLIGLQSIGQLTIKDVAALVPFTLIVYLYLGYGRKLAAENA